MEYIISIILDEDRFKKIRGTPLEEKVKGLFGGTLKVIDLKVSEQQAKKILESFPKSRIDSRNHIEETPVSFRRELFDLLVAKGEDALNEILKDENLSRIRSLAAKEDDYITPP